MRNRAKVTARSGFTHIRICNDCKQQINQDDLCKCTTVTPFVKGAEVTVCSGGQPVRLAVVGRVGNGAFRLEGEQTWFGLDGAVKGEPTPLFTVRMREPGDQNYLEAIELAKQRSREVSSILSKINDLQNSGQRSASTASGYRKEAALLSVKIQQINIAELGETARRHAEQEAVSRIHKLQEELIHARELSQKADASAKEDWQAIKELRAQLDALPQDVKSILELGGVKALTTYVPV